MYESTPEALDALYRDKVRAARGMSPSEKLLAGPCLFDLACEVTKAGIRAQCPAADEARVLEILRRRLTLARRLEEVR